MENKSSIFIWNWFLQLMLFRRFWCFWANTWKFASIWRRRFRWYSTEDHCVTCCFSELNLLYFRNQLNFSQHLSSKLMLLKNYSGNWRTFYHRSPVTASIILCNFSTWTFAFKFVRSSGNCITILLKSSIWFMIKNERMRKYIKNCWKASFDSRDYLEINSELRAHHLFEHAVDHCVLRPVTNFPH